MVGPILGREQGIPSLVGLQFVDSKQRYLRRSLSLR